MSDELYSRIGQAVSIGWLPERPGRRLMDTATWTTQSDGPEKRKKEGSTNPTAGDGHGSRENTEGTCVRSAECQSGRRPELPVGLGSRMDHEC